MAYRFLGVYVLLPAGQRIRGVVTRASSIGNPEVKAREEFGLACLSAIKLFCRYKVLQDLIVRKDLDPLRATIQLCSPVTKGADDHKYLLVVDLVV